MSGPGRAPRPAYPSWSLDSRLSRIVDRAIEESESTRDPVARDTLARVAMAVADAARPDDDAGGPINGYPALTLVP